ncbi:hypothetical protein CYMTET_50428 [Cymbomonas tetramitiformis]|uniref:Uncharacterized protein n=1 Tax=Cymbomonas tetramitiformis TaxID=36881 RepID=A0AAE0BP94_9CHLO|nr:hypothetical protein CYMTET_50428 [Cymbomonas tetramitiformis]
MLKGTFHRSIVGCKCRLNRRNTVREVFRSVSASSEEERRAGSSAAGYWRKESTSWRPVARDNKVQRQRLVQTAVSTGDITGNRLEGVDGCPVDSSQRLRVAVDVDEVLGRFVYALNNYIEEEHKMIHDVSDYSVYDFKTIWNCSQQESNELVHSFFESPHFFEGIPPIPGAAEALKRLTTYCDLVVVTSRQHVIQEPTLQWLDQHFPETFAEVCFGNHFALEGTSRTKSEICKELGAEVLVDDNPGYAMECAEGGIKVLLFDWKLQYPWSKTEGGGPLHENITRVSDWAAVEAVLAAQVLYDGR